MNKLLGIHPHMVTKGMIQRISSHFDKTVEVFSPLGSENKLLNRFNGDYASIKRSANYSAKTHDTYIAPFIHTKAALELFSPVNEILKSRRKIAKRVSEAEE